MTRLTSRLFLLGGLLLCGSGISDLSAQITPAPPPGEDTGPEFLGFVGILQPLSNLTEDPSTYGTAIPPDLLMGGEVTWWASRVVGIGLMGLYSPAILNPVGGGGLGRNFRSLGEIEYMTGMASLTFRFRSSGSTGLLEPYASVGAGLRRLRFAAQAVPEISATDPAATIAAGLRVSLSESVWLRGEVRDMASFYISAATDRSRLQNDVVITLGLGIR
ncbi:hypothetical protein [Candidatus Palauibacter sp.]|uniref:hypothetical protein n=1 Tax=Candidatus Palauibacter sp. TaxID=3101350 RepID=UPI003B51BB42